MNVLIFGLGHIFTNHYFHWIATNPNVSNIYLFDSRPNACSEFQSKQVFFSKSKIHFLSHKLSLDDCIHHSSPRKIFILTNNSSHYHLASQILTKYSIDILVEKPLCFLREQEKELFYLSNIQKCMLFPAYHQFFRSETQNTISELKRLSSSGLLKTININAGSNRGYPKHSLKDGFTYKKLADGGVLLDLGSHYISLANYFLLTLAEQLTSFTVLETDSKFSDHLVSNQDIVENHFKAKVLYNQICIDLIFSYITPLTPSIEFHFANKSIMWPDSKLLLYSNLAFKNMISLFISSSYLSPPGGSKWFEDYLQSITNSIYMIESIYASDR